MIALISDIHGNYEALKQVLAQIDSMLISDIYCLGDVVGYYSQVNECCNELRKRKIKCVMGNHDWYLASGTQCERSLSVNDCLKYQREIITKENLHWLTEFQVMIHEHDISLVHGGWNNPIDEYAEINTDYFLKIEGNYFASGHSHVQKIVQCNDKFYCNPGSVGQPRDGDINAAYATFDGREFKLYRVSYDIEKVCYLMNKAGFAPYYCGCLRDASPRLHA